VANGLAEAAVVFDLATRVEGGWRRPASPY
jgi:hypothetical protein